MTSLLQFNGKVDRRRGVRLLFYLVQDVEKHVGDVTYTVKEATELADCTECEGQHPQLYAAWRKPRGTMGHWVIFQYNGEEHVPDLSVPIRVYQVPRGGKPLSLEENSQYWHT